MPIEKFIIYIKKTNILNSEDEKLIHQYFKVITAKKNEILINEGEICSKLYFVTKGLMRVFHTNEKGNEFTRNIAEENQFCTNIVSFKNSTPSTENVQTIENTTLLCITNTNFYNLLVLSTNIKSIYYKMIEEFQVSQIKRFEFMTSFSKIEQYKIFEKENKALKERLSNKTLASYLCISPENCSRIK